MTSHFNFNILFLFFYIVFHHVPFCGLKTMYTQSRRYWKEQDGLYWKRRPTGGCRQPDQHIGWRSNKSYSVVPSITEDIWDACTCALSSICIYLVSVYMSGLHRSGFHHCGPLVSQNHVIWHVNLVITHHYPEVQVLATSFRPVFCRGWRPSPVYGIWKGN